MNKKSIISIVLSALFALSFSIFSFASELENNNSNYFSGSGTELSPYLINDAEDIINLSSLVNSGDSNYVGAYYRMTDDIDLTGVDYTPIGTETNPFSGVFDGGSYIINGLTINSTERYLGFFGVTKNANLMNINIKNADINTSGSELVYAGILVGLFNVIDETDTFNVEKCSVEGTIYASCTASGYSGGIAGKCDIKHGYLIFSNCHSDIKIYVESNRTACGAGVIGNMDANNNGFLSVLDTVSVGSVEAKSFKFESYVAGIIGKANQQDGSWSDLVPIDKNTSGESSLMVASNVYSFNGCVVDCELISDGRFSYISNLAAHATEHIVVGTNYASSETYVEPSAVSDITCDVIENRETLLSKNYLSDVVGLDFVNTWVSVFYKPELRKTTPYIVSRVINDKVYVQLVGFSNGNLYAAVYSGTDRMLDAKIYSYNTFIEEPKEINFGTISFDKIRLFMLDTLAFSPLSEFSETHF